MRTLLVQFNTEYLTNLKTVPKEPVIVYQSEHLMGILDRDNPHLDWVDNNFYGINQVMYTVIMEQ